MKKSIFSFLLTFTIFLNINANAGPAENLEKIRKFMENNPMMNQYGGKDVFLEIYGIFSGEWSPIILFFGGQDDLYNCNEIAEFYKNTDPSLKYRCTEINNN